jgi:GTP-binding protein Era
MNQPFKSGFAVMFGRPNTGKSTLLNRLVGTKVAIVSPRPQTTRNRIAGVLNLAEGQIVFLDTPGIHEPKHKLGEYLVASAKAALPGAEVILFVADASDSPHTDDVRSAEMLRSLTSPVLLVLNKLDLVRPGELEKRVEEFQALGTFKDWVAVSALEGTNIDALLQKIVAELPEGPPYFPPEVRTDRPPEFMVAELIREQVLHHTREEIPHAVAVNVEAMEPRPNNLLYIAATVFVERASQKKIIIGEGGQMLRRIGQGAREGIQELLGKKVYLELWVKVREKWRTDERQLRRLGYTLKE